MNAKSPTHELARELREILDQDTESPEELFERLVADGIIDRTGRVICQKLFGEGAGQGAPAVPDKNGQ